MGIFKMRSCISKHIVRGGKPRGKYEKPSHTASMTIDLSMFMTWGFWIIPDININAEITGVL